MGMHTVTRRQIAAVLALFGTCGMSAALADPPAAQDAPASTAAPATSATSTTAATPTAAADANAAAATKTASAAPAAADNDALEKRLTNSGYKSRMRNGTKVWCKRQDELGSRLGAQEVCATTDEWRRTFRENQDVVEHIQKIDSHASGK
jgi:hypothetical protein